MVPRPGAPGGEVSEGRAGRDNREHGDATAARRRGSFAPVTAKKMTYTGSDAPSTRSWSSSPSAVTFLTSTPAVSETRRGSNPIRWPTSAITNAAVRTKSVEPRRTQRR